MAAINHSTVLKSLRWFAWPTLLSGAMLVHFLISAAIWLFWLVAMICQQHMRDEFLPSLTASIPAFVLCALCGALFVLALRGRPVARRGVLFALAAAATFFFIDVHFGRWQIHVFVATKEYWEAGGRTHEYFTWWWYNDRWFR